MRLGNRWVVAALTVVGLAGAAGRASAQQHPLFNLHHALWELRDARTELKESVWQFGEHKAKAARPNFDGHKEAALRDMDVAIVQIEDLLKFAKK